MTGRDLAILGRMTGGLILFALAYPFLKAIDWGIDWLTKVR